MDQRNGTTPVPAPAPARRHLNWWHTFNAWWRAEYDRLGRRPRIADVDAWYHENAEKTWGDEKPSLETTRDHAKCLRSKKELREYFARYNARKARKGAPDDAGSPGGADAATPPRPQGRGRAAAADTGAAAAAQGDPPAPNAEDEEVATEDEKGGGSNLRQASAGRQEGPGGSPAPQGQRQQRARRRAQQQQRERQQEDEGTEPEEEQPRQTRKQATASAAPTEAAAPQPSDPPPLLSRSLPLGVPVPLPLSLMLSLPEGDDPARPPDAPHAPDGATQMPPAGVRSPSISQPTPHDPSQAAPNRLTEGPISAIFTASSSMPGVSILRQITCSSQQPPAAPVAAAGGGLNRRSTANPSLSGLTGTEVNGGDGGGSAAGADPSRAMAHPDDSEWEQAHAEGVAVGGSERSGPNGSQGRQVVGLGTAAHLPAAGRGPHGGPGSSRPDSGAGSGAEGQGGEERAPAHRPFRGRQLGRARPEAHEGSGPDALPPAVSTEAATVEGGGEEPHAFSSAAGALQRSGLASGTRAAAASDPRLPPSGSCASVERAGPADGGRDLQPSAGGLDGARSGSRGGTASGSRGAAASGSRGGRSGGSGLRRQADADSQMLSLSLARRPSVNSIAAAAASGQMAASAPAPGLPMAASGASAEAAGSGAAGPPPDPFRLTFAAWPPPEDGGGGSGAAGGGPRAPEPTAGGLSPDELAAAYAAGPRFMLPPSDSLQPGDSLILRDSVREALLTAGGGAAAAAAAGPALHARPSLQQSMSLRESVRESMPLPPPPPPRDSPAAALQCRESLQLQESVRESLPRGSFQPHALQARGSLAGRGSLLGARDSIDSCMMPPPPPQLLGERSSAVRSRASLAPSLTSPSGDWRARDGTEPPLLQQQQRRQAPRGFAEPRQDAEHWPPPHEPQLLPPQGQAPPRQTPSRTPPQQQQQPQQQLLPTRKRVPPPYVGDEGGPRLPPATRPRFEPQPYRAEFAGAAAAVAAGQRLQALAAAAASAAGQGRGRASGGLSARAESSGARAAAAAAAAAAFRAPANGPRGQGVRAAAAGAAAAGQPRPAAASRVPQAAAGAAAAAAGADTAPMAEDDLPVIVHPPEVTSGVIRRIAADGTAVETPVQVITLQLTLPAAAVQALRAARL